MDLAVESDAALRSSRILIVDDLPSVVRLLEHFLLRAGYRDVVSTTDPRKALDLYRETKPDLIILDLHMPYLDGFDVLERLRPEIAVERFLPILILTGDLSGEAKQHALSSGAKDFLSKPFDQVEALLRIENLLRTRLLYREVQRRNESLEAEIRERTRELECAQIEVLERLTQAVEFHDDTTGRHTRRVAEISAGIAEALGLPSARVDLIRRAAPLHDVGKVAIPDAILRKPDRLTPEEFEIMKTHTTVGARILSGGSSELMSYAEQIALAHHERWDGTGYPEGLRGERIPLVARIVALADFYDALSHDRPYRKAWTKERVREEIRLREGAHFDPAIVEAFLGVVR